MIGQYLSPTYVQLPLWIGWSYAVDRSLFGQCCFQMQFPIKLFWILWYSGDLGLLNWQLLLFNVICDNDYWSYRDYWSLRDNLLLHDVDIPALRHMHFLWMLHSLLVILHPQWRKNMCQPAYHWLSMTAGHSYSCFSYLSIIDLQMEPFCS